MAEPRAPVVDWQTTKGTVRDRTTYLFNNSLLSDIEFVVKDSAEKTVRVPAHKLVLAISSPVFEAMFYGELAETRRKITLPDTELPYLLEFLRFLYCDKPKLTTDNAFGVLYLAQKYIVPPLADKCWKFIDKNPCACLESDNAVFTSNGEILTCVVKRDTLQINKELELFEAMKHWAEKRCRAEGLEPSSQAVRKALGDVMNLVRWPAISLRDFAQHVVPTGVLTGQESLDVYEYYAGAPAGRKRKYSEICRAGAFVDAELHECCREVEKFSSSTTSSEYLELECDLVFWVENRNVHLKGVELITQVRERKSKEETLVNVDMCLLNEDGEELAATTGDQEEVMTMRTPSSFKDWNTSVISVKFKNAVLIRKGVEYTLAGKLRCSDGKFVPDHDTVFADSVSAENVSFTFDGACPVYKLLFYKLD